MADKTAHPPAPQASSIKPRVAGAPNGGTTTPTVKPGTGGSTDPLNVRKPQ